jgi:DNA-binding MarR family transcriptional regulator
VSNHVFDPIAEARLRWVEHWGEEPAPSMAAVTSIMRVQQILMGRLNALLRPVGLTFPRYEALMLLYLSRRGSLPLSRMGQRLQVHPTSITSLVDGLEQRGFVRREPHESDRRTTLASITASGRTAAARATGILNDAKFGTEPLTDKDLTLIFNLLRKPRAHADGFEVAASSRRPAKSS